MTPRDGGFGSKARPDLAPAGLKVSDRDGSRPTLGKKSYSLIFS